MLRLKISVCTHFDSNHFEQFLQNGVGLTATVFYAAFHRTSVKIFLSLCIKDKKSTELLNTPNYYTPDECFCYNLSRNS